MTVWAGVDIGNATTEVVLCELLTGADERLRVITSGRTPTHVTKGSPRSIERAARLVEKLARHHNVQVEHAAFAPTPPVDSSLHREVVSARTTGRLAVAVRDAATTAGAGVGVGFPLDISMLTRAEPGKSFVVCAGKDQSFGEVARQINASVDRGVDVASVLCENDEAVLIANRLRTTVPVVDGVHVADVLASTRVAVEVGPDSAPLTKLTDPFWLTSAFGLKPKEQGDAQHVAEHLFDSVCAVVLLREASSITAMDRAAEQPRVDKSRCHTVALAEVAQIAHSRRGSVAIDGVVRASLTEYEGVHLAADDLAGHLDCELVAIDSEARAARAGALTTPGARAGQTVVDVGGGTVDVISSSAQVVLAGAGQLLTETTAAALGISRSASEYAKRAECVAAVTTQLIEDEHGRRRFLSEPLTGEAVGWLLTDTWGKLVPFTSRLAAPEWRAWRHAAKRLTIAANIEAGLAQVSPEPTGVLLVGGGAGDDELVRIVSESLSTTVPVGRANVAGQLGHRYAVAYGLVVIGAGLA